MGDSRNNSANEITLATKRRTLRHRAADFLVKLANKRFDRQVRDAIAYDDYRCTARKAKHHRQRSGLDVAFCFVAAVQRRGVNDAVIAPITRVEDLL